MANLRDTWSLETIYLSKDGQLLLQKNRRGRFYIYAVADGRFLVNGLLIDGEILLFSNDGSYDGTAEASSFVYWQFSGARQHHSFSQFEAGFTGRPGFENCFSTRRPGRHPARCKSRARRSSR